MTMETVRWKPGDPYDAFDRLTDDTLVTVTNSDGETYTSTTRGTGCDRFFPFPLGTKCYLRTRSSWVAEVPVETTYPSWLNLVEPNDVLRDRDGNHWFPQSDDSITTLWDRHGPLTPLVLAGKPALAWEDIDRDMLERLRLTFDWEASSDATIRRFSNTYTGVMAVLRDHCTVHSRTKGQGS